MMRISVKAARVNAGVSQMDAAKAVGLTVGGYSKKENGERRFYVDEIATLSQLFGVPVTDFSEVRCLKKTQELQRA